MISALGAALVVAGGFGSSTLTALATVIILTDPATLERRTVVLDTPGPDRVLLCMAPPAVAGCRQVPLNPRR